MKTVTMGVSSIDDFNRSVKAAVRGERQPPRIDFASAELMFKTMTAKRWGIVRAMAGAGPLSIREVARRVKRDVKGVHADVHALLNCGVLDKDDRGRVVFPFERVRIDVVLKAA
jgi:predicted transcriptional regulator